VHEHEFARHLDWPLLLERLMDGEGLLAGIFGGGNNTRDGAHPVFHQGAIDEARPDIENVDELVRQPLEAPDLIGMHDPRAVIGHETAIEIDDAFDEARWEEADAAIVEKIEADGPPRLIEGG